MRRRAASARQISIGTFDNFNLAVAGVKGSIASAVALIYESLMTPSLDEVSTEYGALAEAVSHPDDFSFVIYRLRAAGEMARRQAGDAGGRDLLARCLQEISSAIFGLLPPRREGGKDRRSRHQVHLRCAGQPRTAADRGPAHRAAEALVGRHRQRRPQARHLRDDAGEAARLRPLSHQGIRRRAVGHAGAGQGLLGPRSRRQYRAQQFRRAALRIFPRLDRWRSRPSRAIRSTGAPKTAPRTGRRPTTFRPSPTSACCSRNFRTAAPESCRRSR